MKTKMITSAGLILLSQGLMSSCEKQLLVPPAEEMKISTTETQQLRNSDPQNNGGSGSSSLDLSIRPFRLYPIPKPGIPKLNPVSPEPDPDPWKK